MKKFLSLFMLAIFAFVALQFSAMKTARAEYLVYCFSRGELEFYIDLDSSAIMPPFMAVVFYVKGYSTVTNSIMTVPVAMEMQLYTDTDTYLWLYPNERTESGRISQSSEAMAVYKILTDPNTIRIKNERARARGEQALAQKKAKMSVGDKFYAAGDYSNAVKNYAVALGAYSTSYYVNELINNLCKNGNKLKREKNYAAALDYYKKAAVMMKALQVEYPGGYRSAAELISSTMKDACDGTSSSSAGGGESFFTINIGEVERDGNSTSMTYSISDKRGLYFTIWETYELMGNNYTDAENFFSKINNIRFVPDREKGTKVIMGVVEEAKVEYSSVAKKYCDLAKNMKGKNEVKSLISAGDQAYSAKDYSAAIESYESARKLDGSPVYKIFDELVKNGDDLTAQGNLPAALDYYKKAVVMNPADSAAKRKLLATYRSSKNFSDAANFYQSITTIKPDDYYYFCLGYSLDELKDYDGAIAAYTRSAELNPNDAKAYYNRGYAYDNLKQYERAIQDYNKAIQLNPNYAKAYNNRGNAYIHIQQYERAIADATKAIELDPNHANSYGVRGNAYLNLKQYDKAIADATKAIELNPNLVAAYQMRGYCYQKLGDNAKAQADFAKAKQLGFSG